MAVRDQGIRAQPRSSFGTPQGGTLAPVTDRPLPREGFVYWGGIAGELRGSEESQPLQTVQEDQFKSPD